MACLLSAGFAGVAAYFGEPRHRVGDGLRGGRAVDRLDRRQPADRAAGRGRLLAAGYLVPGTIAAAALVGRPAGAAVAQRRRRASGGRAGPGARCSRDPSARRWALAELAAYSAWTAELTYAGAFYIQNYGLDVSEVGFLLAAGSVVFLVASLNTARAGRPAAAPAADRRLAPLAMGVLLSRC